MACERVKPAYLLNMQPTMGGPPLTVLGERIINPISRAEEGRIRRNVSPALEILICHTAWPPDAR